MLRTNVHKFLSKEQSNNYYLATNFTNELKNPPMAGKLIQILNFTRITK